MGPIGLKESFAKRAGKRGPGITLEIEAAKSLMGSDQGKAI